jgi:hypothetical protein
MQERKRRIRGGRIAVVREKGFQHQLSWLSMVFSCGSPVKCRQARRKPLFP